MSKSPTSVNIFENPHPEGALPPPWYRPPPGVTKGPTRTRACIVAGLLITNDEGRRWFKQKYNYQLADHHGQDLNVLIRLEDLVKEKGIAFGCFTAPRRLESDVTDTLVITQIIEGPFVHDGPQSYEEVYEEDRKPVPGVREEEIKVQLKNEFSERGFPTTTSPLPNSLFFLGIEKNGFKSYYSNAYYC